MTKTITLKKSIGLFSAEESLRPFALHVLCCMILGLLIITTVSMVNVTANNSLFVTAMNFVSSF